MNGTSGQLAIASNAGRMIFHVLATALKSKARAVQRELVRLLRRT
jgi:hypothetical protein